MNHLLSLAPTASLVLVCAGCDRSEQRSDPAPATADPSIAAQADTPLLPVTKGDQWTYHVTLEIPAGVTSPGAAEVSEDYKRVRTYLGKISPTEGLPDVDCFEVTAPGSPAEREFVEIRDDVIMMLGSMIMRPETTQPMWLDPPVRFIAAGDRPGNEALEVRTPDGSLSRKTDVQPRESIAVPAGSFTCIRLLTTGMDGEINLTRTVWFSPGTGIVREEKTRHRRGKVIFRENQELIDVQLAKPRR